MSKLKHTPGPWRIGKIASTVVADYPIQGGVTGTYDVDYYGGFLVCESISSVNAHLIAASPELFLSVALTRELLQSIVPLMVELDRLEGTKYKSLLKEIIHTQDLLIAKAEGKVEETAEVRS